MTHDKHELLNSIFSRLCFHSGATPDDELRRARFVASLAGYPDDLVCAAYQHLLHHLPQGHVPDESEFIAFMAPEFERRQLVEA